MSSPLIIDYYSDVLCVWAWIAQRRIDELNATLANKIDINYYYMDVFGDAVNKIPSQWHDKGGYQGFAKHVINSASVYEHVKINNDIWSRVRPTSSAVPHLVLKAIALSYSREVSVDFALKFRHAFFVDAVDISQVELLLTLIDKAGFDSVKVNEVILNGSAMAALMQNYQQAQKLNLQGSPSYIIDQGRQMLYGNVGYRLLLANIESALHKPKNDTSWY